MVKVSDQVISALATQYEQLLKNHWIEIWSTRNGTKPDLSVWLHVRIVPNDETFKLATVLSFGGEKLRYSTKTEITPQRSEDARQLPSQEKAALR